VFLFAAVKVPESVLPSRRTSVSLQTGIAIASVRRDASDIDLVFIAVVLSGFLIVQLCSESLKDGVDRVCLV
jgi:hypothetical protein